MTPSLLTPPSHQRRLWADPPDSPPPASPVPPALGAP